MVTAGTRQAIRAISSGRVAEDLPDRRRVLAIAASSSRSRSSSIRQGDWRGDTGALQEGSAIHRWPQPSATRCGATGHAQTRAGRSSRSQANRTRPPPHGVSSKWRRCATMVIALATWANDLTASPSPSSVSRSPRTTNASSRSSRTATTSVRQPPMTRPWTRRASAGRDRRRRPTRSSSMAERGRATRPVRLIAGTSQEVRQPTGCLCRRWSKDQHQLDETPAVPAGHHAPPDAGAA